MNQPVRNRRTPLFLGIACIMALTFSCAKKEDYRIGYVGGLTGRHYNLGISGRNGVELAVDDINRQGGINGKKLELAIRDDRQDPEAALNADRELLGQGIKVLIGHMTSAMTKAVLPELSTKDVLVISPTTSSAEFADKDDNFIMLYPTTKLGAEYMARYASETFRLKRVAVIYDLSNKSYTESWANFFRGALEKAGGAVPAAITFTSGKDASFTAIAKDALKSNPDGVLVVAGAVDTAMICQQIRKLSRSTRILSCEWAFTSDIIQHGGSAVEGTTFVQKVNMQSTNPRFLAFREAYAKRFGSDPDFAAVMAYEAVLVAADGMRKGRTTREIKAAILKQGTFAGLDGDFTINASGDASRRHYIMTIRDGQFRVVEPVQ